MNNITINGIIEKLFGTSEYPDWGTPAHDIYESEFKLEVTVEDANWIENDGWGCERPNRPDENDANYNLQNKETIIVTADSYIGDEYKKDFIAHLYTENLENGEISKFELENWINDSMQKCISFFNNFMVADTNSGAPNDIYCDIKIDKNYCLEDLNPDWKDAKYNISGFDELEESSRINIF